MGAGPHLDAGFLLPGAVARPPSTGPTLPAAARVAVYLVAWFGCVNLVQLPYAVLVLWRILQSRRALDTAQLASRLSDPAALGWTAAGIVEYATLAATLAVTWFLVRVIDREPWTVAGFSPTRRQAAEWVAGFTLGGLLLATVFIAGIAVGWYRVVGWRPASVPAAAGLVVGALLILLPAAAVEEITLRGYVLRVLRDRYGWKWALGVSALLFALLHAANPAFFTSPGAAPGLLLAGVYLGAAYLLTGRLYLPIAVHTAWNLFEGPIFGFRVSGITTPSLLQLQETAPALWSGGGFGPEAGCLLPLALLVHLPLLWLVARRLGISARASAPLAS
jgi:uncharacterized protein